jgi:seryl-tRNA synthetase
MTLDITSFIDNKGGNSEEIRESQRKRGDPVELVDEVVAMYTEWVKSAPVVNTRRFLDSQYEPSTTPIVDYEVNGLRKQVNGVQKEIATKKKVRRRTLPLARPREGCIAKPMQ